MRGIDVAGTSTYRPRMSNQIFAASLLVLLAAPSSDAKHFHHSAASCLVLASMVSVVQAQACNSCDNTPITFDGASVMYDNFAGHVGGSSPAELRYTGVGSYLGNSLDLVITSLNGQNGCNSNNDACSDVGYTHWGGIGAIRGEDNALEMTFTLRYTNSNAEAVLPIFCFTFIDIGRSSDRVEFLVISGLNSYAMGSDIKVITGGTLNGETALEFRNDDGPNPSNPGSASPTTLSEGAYKATVRLHFENTASFNVKWGAMYGSGCCQRTWFAGNSNVPGECPVLSDPLPPPPPSPSPPPARRRFRIDTRNRNHGAHRVASARPSFRPRSTW